MHRRLLPLLGLLLAACASSGARAPDDARFSACRRLLEEQAAAWNQGDIRGFAAGYWQSKDLVFGSPDGATLGFEPMLARYQRGYPDRAAMGRLAFDDLSFRALDTSEVVATGSWRLERAADAPHGRFLLIFRPVGPNGTWRIVLDYTTSAGTDARSP